MDTLAIIKRIESRLVELGMSKAEFYGASGISSASFSQWRTGIYKPSLKKVEKAAEILGVSADYLINGTRRVTETAYTNGICVYSGSTNADIEKKLSEKEHGTYRVVYRAHGVAITVDNDGGASAEQIDQVIAIYDPNYAKKAPAGDGKRSVSDDDIKFALFGGDGEITDAMYERVKQFAAFIKKEEADKKKG